MHTVIGLHFTWYKGQEFPTLQDSRENRGNEEKGRKQQFEQNEK